MSDGATPNNERKRRRGESFTSEMLQAAARTGTFTVTSMRSSMSRKPGKPEIPDLRRLSGPLLASVFTEELALLTMSRLGARRFQKDGLAERSREVDRALALFAAHGWLDDAASYHVAPPAPERFTLQKSSIRKTRYELLAFDSGYEPVEGMPGSDRWLGAAANRRNYAHVLEHRGAPRPWLVFLHPMGMGRPMDLLFIRALRYHRDLGLNVLLPVAPLHGLRGVSQGGEGLMSTDWVMNIHGLTQAVWDVRSMLAWIRERGNSSIAVHGMSFGGYTAALLAGLEPDLACAVAGVPAASVHRPLVEFCRCDPDASREMVRHDLLGDRVEALHSIVTPTSLPCLLPHDRRFIYAGLADRIATPLEPLALWEHWERPEILWSATSHIATLTSPRVRRFARDAIVNSLEKVPATVAPRVADGATPMFAAR